MLLCIIMFQKKDIFHKYLMISKYLIAKKLAIHKTFLIVTLKQKNNI